VTLLFDVGASPSLTEAQRERIRLRLARRISRDGVLRVVSQQFRTREANRRAAVERLHELLAAALARPRPRRPTAVPAASRRLRVESKRRRASLKRSRKPGTVD
jgi:ribosome-associated protein